MEYWEVKSRRTRYFYGLLIGILIVISSMIMAFLATEEYEVKKQLRGDVILNKDEMFHLKFYNGSYLSYAYVKNGIIEINSTKPFLFFYGSGVKLANNTFEHRLYNFSGGIFFQSLENNNKLSFSFNYTLTVKPYFNLSLPSLFLLIFGSIFCFLSLFYFFASKRNHHWR